jgi:hypothetical protein
LLLPRRVSHLLPSTLHTTHPACNHNPTRCVRPSHASTVGIHRSHASNFLDLTGLRPDSKSKIKCHHEGEAPCQACIAASRPDCLLSAPTVRGKAHPDGNPAAHVRPREYTETHPSLTSKRPRLASPTPTQRASHIQPTLGPVVTCPDLPTPALMLQACHLLQTCFPEFGFLHRPSFTDQLVAGSVNTAKLHAILSVTARFMPSLVSQHRGPEAAGHYYAARAETAVMARVLDAPDPEIVQSLLLISLHHWGTCNGSRAWMLAGMPRLYCDKFPELTVLQASQLEWHRR